MSTRSLTPPAPPAAEEVGLDFFGFGEHHTRSMPLSSPTAMVNAAAASTRRIGLGTKVTVLSTDEPIRVFQQLATAASMAPGRIEVVAGRGSSAVTFPLFDLDERDYDMLYRSKLDLLLELNRHERVSWAGGHRRRPLQDTVVVPRPEQPLRIWLGTGGSPESVLRAVELGLPMFLGILGGTPEHWAQYGDAYRHGWAEVGHPAEDARIAVAVHGFVAESDRDAKATFLEHELRMFQAGMAEIGRPGPPPSGRDADYQRAGMVFAGGPNEIAERSKRPPRAPQQRPCHRPSAHLWSPKHRWHGRSGAMTSAGNIDTPRIPATSTYHGVTVSEDYRWLEDGASEETKAWTGAQNTRTRQVIEGLPSYAAVRRRVQEIAKAESVAWGRASYGMGFEGPRRAGAAYLVLKRQPPKQQPFLVALTDLDDVSGARVVVDPNVIDGTGATTIDWFVPAPDGRLVAVSLSSHGTEDGTLHLFEVASGDLVDVVIPRVQGGTAGGSLAWAGDSSGFWYTRSPAPGEHPEQERAFFQEVWHHLVGEPVEGDRRDEPGPLADPKIVQHHLQASPDGRWVMDRAQRGDSGEWQVFVRSPRDGGWWQVAGIADKCVGAVFGGESLYFLSYAAAPRGQVLRLRVADGATVAQADCVVPAGDTTIESIAATDTRLWVVDIDGGPSGLRVCGTDGEHPARVDVGPVAAVDSLGALDAHEIVYAVESFTMPRAWFRAGDDAVTQRTALADIAPFDLSSYEVSRESGTSADGTKVPMTLLYPPNTPRDGSAAALLTAYGGFAISLKPHFDPTQLIWLEQGGVLAIANIRGGGEYGEEWHHGARLTTKQNGFDDFVGCARQLIDSGVTSGERLAIMGGSNGGLLMGATLTQHPELARVVVARVPIMDMLRAELHPNGVFVATEYGTVKDREQFEALLAYSPYHHVRDGIAYPATLLTGGEFDPRVDAYHPKKMAARLQAATSSQAPVLLRVEAGGHGIGGSLDDAVAELTDIYTFLFDQVGISYRPPPPMAS